MLTKTGAGCYNARVCPQNLTEGTVMLFSATEFTGWQHPEQRKNLFCTDRAKSSKCKHLANYLFSSIQ